jgi:hypothetical protein
LLRFLIDRPRGYGRRRGLAKALEHDLIGKGLGGFVAGEASTPLPPLMRYSAGA